MNKNNCILSLIYCFIFAVSFSAHSQSITGVWRGKITQHRFGLNKTYQLELKLISNGDSLTGTSYYFSSENNYYRFAVKGYFDPFTGYVVWWDEKLIETISSKTKSTAPSDNGLRYAVDFNCPGEGIMQLDGNAEKINEQQEKAMEVHLDKVFAPFFGDEWDFVIENFALGASAPAIIDSIEALHTNPSAVTNTVLPYTEQKKEPYIVKSPESKQPIPESVVRQTIDENPAIVEKKPMASSSQTIEDKFMTRKKLLVTEIPVSGDSIELNFYDHAEIDGDSISLFLNNKLIYEHILLKASPFTIKLATSDLAINNELIMVAENLGSIPPNTSLMIVYVNGKRHEVRLESTDNASAMIRFIRNTN